MAIQLREFNLNDLESLYSCTNNPLIRPYLRNRYCETINEARRLLSTYIKMNESDKDLALALVFEEDIGTIIGTIEVTYAKGLFEMTAYLKPSLWGNGYMAEATIKSYELIRNKFGACTIIARCVSNRSCKAVSKAGMVYHSHNFHEIYKIEIP